MASTSQNKDVPGVSNDKKRQRNPNKVRTKSHLLHAYKNIYSK